MAKHRDRVADAMAMLTDTAIQIIDNRSRFEPTIAANGSGGYANLVCIDECGSLDRLVRIFDRRRFTSRHYGLRRYHCPSVARLAQRV